MATATVSSIHTSGNSAVPTTGPTHIHATSYNPALDFLCPSGIFEVPNKLGVSSAFTAPKLIKREGFLVSASIAPLGVFTNWRNNVLMSERLRRPSLAGERCSVFFCVKTPKQAEA